MREAGDLKDVMFGDLSSAARVPKDHSLLPIKQIINQALPKLLHDFAKVRFHAIAPGKGALRALLIQVFHTIRSERLLIE